MSIEANQTAEELFEQFLLGVAATDPATLLAQCRPEEREQLEYAFAAVDTVAQFHRSTPPVSTELVGRLRARLQIAERDEELTRRSKDSRLSLSKVRLADAYKRLASIKFQPSVDPVSTFAEALGVPFTMGNTGLTSVLRRDVTKTTRRSFDETWMQAQEQRLQAEASDLLRTLQVERFPVDLYYVADKLDLLVFETNLYGTSERNMEGCLVTDGEFGGVLLNNAFGIKERRRYTFAHEIAHYVLHKTAAVFRDTDKELSDYRTIQETEANLFASALLMPTRQLMRCAKPDLPPSFTQAHSVVSQFQVSLQAALIRIIRQSDYPCCFVVSRRGKVQFSISSPLLEGYVRPNMLLCSGSVAEALQSIQGEGRATKSDNVPQELWFTQQVSSSGWVRESSLRMNEDATYTIIVAQ